MALTETHKNDAESRFIRHVSRQLKNTDRLDRLACFWMPLAAFASIVTLAVVMVVVL